MMLLLCILTNKTIRNEQKMADCFIRRIKLIGKCSQVYKPVPCLSYLWQWIHCAQHLCSHSSCIWRLAHVFSLVTLSPFPHCRIPDWQLALILFHLFPLWSKLLVFLLYGIVKKMWIFLCMLRGTTSLERGLCINSS